MFNQHLKEFLLIVIIGSIRIIHYMRDEILVAGLHVHDKVVQYLQNVAHSPRHVGSNYLL